MVSPRLRLEFKPRNILNESQLERGMRRSWLILKPELDTISDLAAYLLHTFDLHDSCPNGLILSMDGFVLPPFESTSIVKDKDIVCVKRKGDTGVDAIQAGEGLDSLEVEENVEKQHELKNVRLLANEEFEKECDEDDDHMKEYMVPRKRKASKKLQSSNEKKHKVAAAGKCPIVADGDHDDVHAKENGSLHCNSVLPRKSVKKNKSSKLPGERAKSSALESGGRSNDTSKSTRNANRFSQLQENCEGSVDLPQQPGETKKSDIVGGGHENVAIKAVIAGYGTCSQLPSRSARRKKAKRLWLREQVNCEKKKLHQEQVLKKDDEQSPVKVSQTVFEGHQKQDEASDEEDEVVPVVIRPGHIRFERLGDVDVDCDTQQNQTPMERLQWNGITNKKKGQKWGIEKVSSYRRNDRVSLNPDSFGRLAAEEETRANSPINFDKLKPYTSLPKEGDVVAYRLIELSSSWTPELSSFRVGKILRYYPESNRIMLVTVPEYPIDFEKMTEELSDEPDTSPYGEDGSLKITYSSLIDVRAVKHGNLDMAKAVIGEVNEVPVCNQTPISGSNVSNNTKEIPASELVQENGEASAWDEISEALNAKKAQLSQENGWSKEESSGKSAWSYRALRGCALGPTMALLRAQSEL